MDQLPTLLVLANPSAMRQGQRPLGLPGAEDQAMRMFDSLHDTLQKGLECGLPLLLVAPKDVADRARMLLPGNSVVELPDASPTGDSETQADGFARAVVAGVQASAQASGWLILPACTPMLRADTLRHIADASRHQPVVFPQYQQQRGHPVRFSTEFFSELIRLQSERDLSRLIARYPAMGVEVDDPGVLMTDNEMTSFDRYRGDHRGGYADRVR